MPRTGASFALAVLFAINAVNFYDRQVLGALAEPIRKDWRLSDGDIGLLGTAFTFVYAAVGVPLGRLADVVSRRWILSGAVFAWSLLTAASGLARGFGELFALRMGVGIGEAACAPAASSLIGDLFPAGRRGKALSAFMLGLPLGLALSYFVSGRVAQAYGWQRAFLVAGVPGIVLAVLALALPEPARGAAEAREPAGAAAGGPAAAPRTAGPEGRLAPYLRVLSIPTLLWIVVSGALHNFNMYALGSFLAPYLERFHGLSLKEAGDASMAVSLCGAPGLLLGGLAADLAARRSARGRLAVGAFAALASVPFAYLALTRPAGQALGFTACLGAAGLLMYVYYSSVYATIHDVVEPRLRGTAMALYFFAMYFLGAALGPWATGALSDGLTRRAALAAGVTVTTPEALEPFRGEGLRGALHLVPVLALLLAFVLLAATRTVARDMARRRGG
ncbi:MAG: MFS transporter [Planctomycetes bacterium]|nr:MFS transporter [Planctomycetota bacterium]